MQILLIGGTGTISGAITQLLLSQGHDVFMINRGNRPVPEEVHLLRAEVNNEEAIQEWISQKNFDSVVDFIAFQPQDVERDIRLFFGKTKQYVFISSASAYQKPISHFPITEETPLQNPYWDYSAQKASCEERLMKEFSKNGFPVTIVRPSHTYGPYSVPVGLHGANGSWQVIQRIRQGKPVIVQGDGTSLWTLTHTTDFAKGFVGLLGKSETIGEAYHITTDEWTCWNEIYTHLYRYFGQTPRLVPIASELLIACSYRDIQGPLLGDKSNSVIFDNSKLRTVVPHFRAEITVKEGLEKSLDSVLGQPALQKEDPEFDQWCDEMIKRYQAFFQTYKT